MKVVEAILEEEDRAALLADSPAESYSVNAELTGEPVESNPEEASNILYHLFSRPYALWKLRDLIAHHHKAIM